jgi:hypothetical protein
MSVLGLSLAFLLAVAVSIAAHANETVSNVGPANSGPAPSIVLAWDGGGSRGHSGASGGQRTAGQVRHWNGQGEPPHWGPNRLYGAWVPMADRRSRLTGSTFPGAQPLIIRSQIGEAQRAGGVIPSRPVSSGEAGN